MAAQLNRVQAEDYIRKVDNELRQQRRRLLALDTPLSVLLPQHLLACPRPSRLTISPTGCCLHWQSGAMHHTPPPICRLRSLALRLCGLFVSEGRTPAALVLLSIKLTELLQDARMAFFDGYLPASHPLRRDADMPQLFRELEVICVMAVSG